MKKFNLLAVVLFFVCFSSCEKKQADKSNDITFDTIRVAETAVVGSDSLASCQLKIELVYPTDMKQKNLLADIQKEIVGMYFEDDKYLSVPPKEAVPKYVNDFIAAYKADIESYKGQATEWEERDPYLHISQTLLGHILYNKNSVLCFQVERYNAKGENIAATEYKNCVLNLETGKRINESDIFVQDSEQELHDIFVSKILSEKKVKDINELLDLGYFGLEEIMPNNNFWVDSQGITYLFNTGECSSPKLGEMKIHLSYSDIRHLVQENSPINKLME
ncbi:hypothetical protein M2132_001133 [Dysgonomonas sp. PH5-45]|uniref:DUF3298 domain-containing protein n=1 Tax=unclassified Dysgonomonas TaxID=2630389 RepID=UPI0024739027|nr:MULTISPECIES: DUF3298 domain-containing protein [unclassified Dysgonomonas]MDH6354802.1 hypothetical protein [Dysgonomonas sp. PH5-45]MDH6387701.1 hypothetical protein [Dysgonomonas sp. PH5-37]